MKLPKRRKSKDNPYKLGYEDNNNSFTIEFVNNSSTNNKIEITKEVYEFFSEFELEDIRQMHEYERHIEHFELNEDIINSKCLNKQRVVDEIVEDKLLNDEL